MHPPIIHATIVAAACLLTFAKPALAGPAPPIPAAARQRALSEAIEVEGNACFDRESLARDVAHWLGTDVLDARLSIKLRQGEHAPLEPESFVLVREGEVVVERNLPHRNAPCEELRSAISLAIAIAVETTATEGEQQRPVERAVQPSPVPDRAPVTLAHRDQTRSISSEVAGHFFLGLLPRATWGGDVSLMIPLAGPVEMRAGVFFAAPSAIAIGPGVGDVSLWAGHLQACLVRRDRIIDVDLCAGAAAGRLAAHGRNYVVSLSPGLPWAAVLVTLRGRAALSRYIGATLGVDGFVPLARPELDVRTASNELSASSALPVAGGSIGIGVDVHFW